MPSIILSDNGVSSGSAGLKTTAASDGALELQTSTAGGTATTALSISNTQVVTVTNGVSIQGLTIGRGAGSVATNTAVGASALAANSTGSGVTAIGTEALAVSTASNNTAVGYQAAYANTAADNTAIGTKALLTNTSGTLNVATGGSALRLNTTGSSNTALGVSALFSNTTASNNTAVGYQAGYSTTISSYNTSSGYQALYSNTIGSASTAFGANALRSAISADYNTAVGNGAGYSTTGSNNTFIGINSGYNITSGAKNTFLGPYNGNQGGLNLTTASNNIVLSDGDGNPRFYYVGADAAWKSKEIYNFTSANTANMYIGSGYDIGRVTSALKYKQDIRDLEEINIDLFRPVRYKSKCANDDQTKDYFGFIADEVADAGIEELVVRNAEGEVESFAYDRMTVVLLKEVQRLKAEVNALKGQA